MKQWFTEVFGQQAVQRNTWFIDDGINLLHHVKIGLIVGVFDAGASPWNHWQLACRELLTNISAAWNTDDNQMQNNKHIYMEHRFSSPMTLHCEYFLRRHSEVYVHAAEQQREIN